MAKQIATKKRINFAIVSRAECLPSPPNCATRLWFGYSVAADVSSPGTAGGERQGHRRRPGTPEEVLPPSLDIRLAASLVSIARGPSNGPNEMASAIQAEAREVRSCTLGNVGRVPAPNLLSQVCSRADDPKEVKRHVVRAVLALCCARSSMARGFGTRLELTRQRVVRYLKVVRTWETSDGINPHCRYLGAVIRRGRLLGTP